MSVLTRLAKRPQRVPKAVESAARCAVEFLEDRRLMAASPLALGLNANGVTSSNYKSLVTLMRQSHTTSVRLWYGFGSYDSPTISKVVTWVEKFKYDGFDVTLTVNPDNGRVGTAAQTTNLFKFLVAIPGLTNAVDRWEIGNEEDSSNYWKGSLKDYVGDFLAPAAAVLHSVGEKVVSGGVSWNPDDVQRLVDQGMLRYVDYVGYHPYRSSYSDLVSKVAQVKAIAAGKPLVATEWNVRGHEHDSSPTAWAADIAKFWPIIRDNFYAAYYYAGIKVNTPAGPAGLLNSDGTANDPFFSTYNTFQNTLDTSTAVTGAGTTTSGSTAPTTASTGSTQAGTSSTGSTSGGSTSTGVKTGSATSSSGKTPASGKTSTPAAPAPAKPASGRSTASGTTTGSTTGAATATSHTPGRGATTTSSHTATPKPNPPKPKPILPTLTSLALINANTDRVIAGDAALRGTVTIDLATLATSNLTFQAIVNGKVKSVQWSINGATSVDSAGVFSLFGETHARGMTGHVFSPGAYVITAQAFGSLNATGTAAAVQTFTVNFVSSQTTAAANTFTALARIAARKRKAALAAARSPSLASRTLGAPMLVLSGVAVAAKKRH